MAMSNQIASDFTTGLKWDDLKLAETNAKPAYLNNLSIGRNKSTGVHVLGSRRDSAPDRDFNRPPGDHTDFPRVVVIQETEDECK